MQLMSGWKNIIVDSLFIARQHTDARYWYSNSVCLSVRPSVRNVPVSDENGLTYCHSFFHYTIAQSFKFYQHQKSSRHSDGITPCGGDKYKWGIKIFRFSTNKSLYLVNDTKEMILGRINPAYIPLLSTPVGSVERVTNFKLYLVFT